MLRLALLSALLGAVLATAPSAFAALPRATADRADEQFGPQVHAVYVLPSDGADRVLDTDGTIAASVSNFNTWLHTQAGSGLRVDTFEGELDVSFHRLTETDAQLAARGLFIRDEIERQLRAAGFDAAGKIYAVYYDGSSTAACGGGAWPPTLPGTVAAVYMRATFGGGLLCYDPARSRTGLQIMDFAVLHELFHVQGYVPICAPHHTRSGHVSDDPNDLMWAGDGAWTPFLLDSGYDDYFWAGVPGCPDLSSSEYFATSVAPPTLTSFSPPAGPVGSTVQLTGTRFESVLGVSLGNQPATFTPLSSTLLEAVVPAAAAAFPTVRWRLHTSTGNIVVVHDTPFTITGAGTATITGFAPTSGPVASAVTLTGTNFVGVSQVSLGNVPTTYTVDSPTSITAQVPAGLTPDGYRWRVTTGAGTAVNEALFTITVPSTAPTLTGFAPGSGAVGTFVALSGTDLGQVTQVTLGNVDATFSFVSPTQILARVPAGAAAYPTVRWRIHWPGGVAVHDTPFVVTGGGPQPPRITSFSPGSGAVGSNVVLTGANFVAVEQVSLGNVPTTFTVDSPTQITAQVPAGLVPDGYRWRVRTPLGTAVNDALFTITQGPVPTIASFSPGSGTVGSNVVLTGTNFVGVDLVSLGNVPTTYTVDSPTQITAQVPGGLTPDGYRWRVRNAAGTGVHDTLFTITPGPVPAIASFAPGSGPVGSQVVLTGTSLDQVTQVTLGNVNAAFTLGSATQITATVPAGAAVYPTVRWRVHWAGGGVALHDTPFVISGGGPGAATIASFAPASGAVGSDVVLTGTNFVGVSQVSLGNVPTTHSVDSPTRITAQVPAGLAPDGYRWRVTTPAGTAVNDTLFTITTPAPPTFVSFAPASGPVGLQVVLTGTNLDQVTDVTLGNQATLFTLVSPTRIHATVPALAAGLPTVRWRLHWAGGGIALHDTPFVITQATKLRVDNVTGFDSVDPALSFFQHSWQMQDATCARLYRYPDATLPGAGPELVPELATALPTISPDGRTYTFQVRPGFRFSPPSNQVVRAETVEASLERMLNPALQSPAQSFFGDIASIESNGDLLTIVLDEPSGDFLARLAMPFTCVVPLGTPANAVGTTPIPSAGPYYLVVNSPEDVIAWRNPSYDGDRERNFDSIHWDFGRSLDEIRTRVENGQADTGPFPPGAAQDLDTRFGPGSPAAAAGRQRYFVRPNQVFWYLALNTERVFANEKLRQAVSYALSRQHLAGLYGHDGGAATDQYLPPGMPAYVNHDLYPLTGNLAEAQRLATESGATPVTVKFYTFNASPGPEIAAYVQSALAPIGITVQVETFTRTIQHQKMGTRGEPFDIGVNGWGADFLDPANFLDTLLDGSSIGPTGNVNQSFFNDPVFNARFDAAAALTGAARTAEYADLDHDLATASPLVAYVNTNARLFFSDRIGCHRFKNGGVALNALCLR